MIASHNYHVQTNMCSLVLLKIPNWTFEFNDIIVLGNAKARDKSGNYVLLDFVMVSVINLSSYLKPDVGNHRMIMYNV